MTRLTNRNDLLNLIFKAVAVALGIAVIVLQVLGSATLETAITLLGLGLTSLALSAMMPKAA